jgi:hypothetical protein
MLLILAGGLLTYLPWRDDPRPLYFLVVVLCHVAIGVLLWTETRRVTMQTKSEPAVLILTFIDPPVSPPIEAGFATRMPQPRGRTFSREAVSESAISVASTPSPPPSDSSSPPIDWSREAELASREIVAREERDRSYRNLAGLSAAQLEWIRRNQMRPMPPGFHWDHRRRDNGNPLGVFWIGEHCVIIAIIPFCRFGHIEPNGDLFKHMRDPKDP